MVNNGRCVCGVFLSGHWKFCPICGTAATEDCGTQPTDVQQLKAETLRCIECEHTYDGSSPTPVTWSRYCYSCLWFPKKPVLTDNFIQRKASAV